MFARLSVRWLAVAIALAVSTCALWAQTKGGKPIRRVAPPIWDKSKTDGVYFEDVFKDAVVGTRPQTAAAPIANTGRPTANPTPETMGDSPPGAVYAWSALISPTTLEDEVKASKKIFDEEVSTPAKFAGNGYKVARKQLSVLAMMFAIIGEYDGEVRWKADAPAARTVFARTAGNCKVGTIQVFNEAKARKAELEDLLNGSGLKDKTGEKKADWKTVTDRSPLMQRLELCHQGRMQPWVANKGEFSDHSEEMFHEAQLTAVFAEILMKEGMEDADDNDYKAYCERLKKASLDIIEAIKGDNYEKARGAVGEIDKTCTECHQSYRA